MQLHKLISQQLHILHFYANTWWQFEYAFGLQLRWSVNRQVGVSLSGRSCTNSPTLEGSRTCFSLGEKPEPKPRFWADVNARAPTDCAPSYLGASPWTADHCTSCEKHELAGEVVLSNCNTVLCRRETCFLLFLRQFTAWTEFGRQIYR